MNFSYERDGCLEEIAYPVLSCGLLLFIQPSIHSDVYV